MAIIPCDPCECIPVNIPDDKFKQDVENILCQTLTALGYEFPEGPCDPCACIQGNIPNDKFKQDVEILLCLIAANVSGGGGGGGTVTSFGFTNANGVSGIVTNPATTPNLTLSLGAITPTSVAASGVVTGSNISGTNTGDQTITLTGNVTGSGTGSFAATIANDAVTYAKIQNVTSARLLGRATAGAGDTEEITLGTGLSYTGTTLNVDGSALAITSLTGEVIGTGPGATATAIVNNAVTLAKIQTIGPNELLGRSNIGFGDVERITVGTGLSFVGTVFTVTGSAIAVTSLTGDVTGTGPGATATTIANDAVTFAKFQNITTARLLGRATAGSGDMEEITLGTGLGFTGTTLDLTFGSSSFLYTADPFLIASLTADGSDTLGADFAGGGAASDTRGGFLTVRGNEDASAGNVVLSAGNVGSATLQLKAPNTVSGAVKLTSGTASLNFDINGNLQFTPKTGFYTALFRSVNTEGMVLAASTAGNRSNGSLLWLDSTGAGGNVYIDTCSGNASAVFSIRNPGVAETDTTVLAIGFITSINDRLRWCILGNGDLLYSSTGTSTLENFIRPGTADAGDVYRGSLCGGGGGVSGGATRGATVRVSGNEHASTPGELLLQSGNVATAGVNLDVGLSTGSFINKFAGTTAKTLTSSSETSVFDTISSVNLNKKVQTTDNTTTTLWSFTLADNTSYQFEALVGGRFSSTTAKGVLGRIFFGAYRNNAGGAVLVEAGGGVENVMNVYGASGYTVAIDVTGNDVRIRVTGATAETVNWGTNVRYVSMT